MQTLKWKECDYTVENGKIKAVIKLNQKERIDLSWMFAIADVNRDSILNNPLFLLGVGNDSKNIFDETKKMFYDEPNSIKIEFKNLSLVHCLFCFLCAVSNIGQQEQLNNDLEDMAGNLFRKEGKLDLAFYNFPVEEDEKVFKYEFWKKFK